MLELKETQYMLNRIIVIYYTEYVRVLLLSVFSKRCASSSKIGAFGAFADLHDLAAFCRLVTGLE